MKGETMNAIDWATMEAIEAIQVDIMFQMLDNGSTPVEIRKHLKDKSVRREIERKATAQAGTIHIKKHGLKRLAQIMSDTPTARTEILDTYQREIAHMDQQRAKMVQARDAVIREDYANGATIAELSRATGLTRTMLYKVINKEDK